MNRLVILLLLLFVTACSTGPAVDKVVVQKSLNKMYLLKGREIVKSYDISLGQNPVGDKVQSGDMRTPEGNYLLIYKNEQSKFYRSITVSYPDEKDIKEAMALGLNPGGDIVIHGFPNEMGNYQGPIQPLNWTHGCIAVRNHEMDELFRLIEIQTPIEIRP